MADLYHRLSNSCNASDLKGVHKVKPQTKAMKFALCFLLEQKQERKKKVYVEFA